MTALDQKDPVETQVKSPEKKSGVLKKWVKAIVLWTLLATNQLSAELTKNSPEVIAKCDTNGKKWIQWREYLCFLDMKKQNAQEWLENAQEEWKKLDKDINWLEKDIKNLKTIKWLLAQK